MALTNYYEVKQKRMQGFDIDYPVIAKIKEEFEELKLSNKFESGNTIYSKKKLIPLRELKYIFNNANTELEKFYINVILDPILLGEKELIFSILKKNKLLYEKADVKFVGDHTKQVYYPYLDKNEAHSMDKKLNTISTISFIEIGSVDIESDDSNINAYLELEVKVENE